MLFFEIIYLGVSGLRAFAFAGALFYGNFFEKENIHFTLTYLLCQKKEYFLSVWNLYGHRRKV